MTHYLELNGEMVSAKECCRRKNLNYSAVRQRVREQKESYEQAIKYIEENPTKKKKPFDILRDDCFYNIWCKLLDETPIEEINQSWLDFKNFVDDMYSEYKWYANTYITIPSICRKNNTKGYYKENCYWA